MGNGENKSLQDQNDRVARQQHQQEQEEHRSLPGLEQPLRPDLRLRFQTRWPDGNKQF